MKYKVECIEGRQDILGYLKIIWSRIIIIVKKNTLTMEFSNVAFG